MAREFSVVVGINATRAVAGGRQFKAGADQVNRSNRSMQRSTAGTTRRMTAMITTIGRLRGVMSVMFAGFLGVGGIGAVIRTLTDFSGALSKVQALLGERALGGAMAALEGRARSLGATTVFTATQAAEGMQFLTLAGFNALEVFQAIGPALTLAQAGALGLGQAADIVSNIMAGFSIEASRTGDVVDALAFVASRTNTNIQQLGEAMKFVAPVAGAVGISVEETAAALGILGNSGLQASLAGTSLRRVFSGLLNPSKEATKVLSGMNLVAEDLVAKIGRKGGLNEVVQILAKRGLGAAEAFTLFGQRGAPGILSLISQREKLDDMNILMEDVTGTAKTMAEVMTDNLGGDARLAISALQEGILQLGDAGLTTWLRETTQEFGGFIRGLTGVKINMVTATDAMKEGIKSGEKFKESWISVKRALVVVATFMMRNMIRAIVLLGAQMLIATAHTLGFTRAMFRLGVTANTTRVAVLRMRAALIASGVGAAVVLVGYLASLFLVQEDLTESNEKLAMSYEDLNDSVGVLIFDFDKLTEAERETLRASVELQQQMAKAEFDRLAIEIDKTRLAMAQEAGAIKDLNAAKEELARRNIIGAEAERQAGRASDEVKVLINDRILAESRLDSIQRQLAQGSTVELIAAQKEYGREVEIASQRLAAMDLIAKNSNLTWAEAVAKVKELSNAKEEFNRKLKEETGLTVDEINTVDKLIKKYDKANLAQITMAEGYEILAKNLATLLMNGKATDEQIQTLIRTMQGMGIAMGEKAAKQAKKLADALEEVEDKTAKLKAGTDKVALATIAHVQAMRDERREMILNEVPLEKQAALLNAMARAHEANLVELGKICDKNKKVRECTDDTAKKMEAIWDRAMSNIQDSFADAFRNIGDGFDDFADGILDAFKDMLAQMAAQAAISNLFGNGNGFFNDFSAGFGGGGSSSTSGVDGAGILSNLFGTGSSGGGGSFWTSLTGIFGGGGTSTNPSFLSSVGSAIRGTGGEVMTGVDVFNMGQGGVQGAQTVSAGGAGSGNIPFFSEFAGGFAQASQGGAGVWASIGEGFSAGFSSISVAGWIAIAMAFNQGLYSSGWRPETGELGEFHTNPIFGQPGFAGEMLRNLGVSEELATLFAGDAVTTRLFGRKAPRATGSGVSIGFENGQLVGEGFTDWIKKGGLFRSDKRGTDVTPLTDVFLTQLQGGVDQLFSPFMEVVTMLGGNVDELLNFNQGNRSIDLQVYDKKGRPQLSDEQVATKLQEFLAESVLDAVESFLRETDSISEAFRNTALQFEGDSQMMLDALRLLASIDAAGEFDFLQTIADAQAESTVTITDAMVDNVSILRDVIGAYDGSLESLQALEAAYGFVTASQFELVVALQAVGAEISAMFQDSAQTIREALLSEEELYDLRRSQIDDLVAQAAMTTDPVELAALAAEINRLGLDAFGMLDQSQIEALGPEFIAFFEGLDSLFGDQIAEGINDVITEQQELDVEVANAMNAAAEQMIQTQEAAEELYKRWLDDIDFRNELYG